MSQAAFAICRPGERLRFPVHDLVHATPPEAESRHENFTSPITTARSTNSPRCRAGAHGDRSRLGSADQGRMPGGALRLRDLSRLRRHRVVRSAAGKRPRRSTISWSCSRTARTNSRPPSGADVG